MQSTNDYYLNTTLQSLKFRPLVFICDGIYIRVQIGSFFLCHITHANVFLLVFHKQESEKYIFPQIFLVALYKKPLSLFEYLDYSAPMIIKKEVFYQDGGIYISHNHCARTEILKKEVIAYYQ